MNELNCYGSIASILGLFVSLYSLYLIDTVKNKLKQQALRNDISGKLKEWKAGLKEFLYFTSYSNVERVTAFKKILHDIKEYTKCFNSKKIGTNVNKILKILKKDSIIKKDQDDIRNYLVEIQSKLETEEKTVNLK